MAIRHITLFRLDDTVSEADKDEALARLRSLRTSLDLADWEVAESLDTRRGMVLVVNSTFADVAALAAFAASPAHIEVANFMRGIAAWLVADYEV